MRSDERREAARERALHAAMDRMRGANREIVRREAEAIFDTGLAAYEAALREGAERFCTNCDHTAGKHTGTKRGGSSCDVGGCRCAALSEHPERILDEPAAKAYPTPADRPEAPKPTDSEPENAPIIEGLLSPKELADWRANLLNPETWKKVKRLAEDMLEKLAGEHSETGERDYDRSEDDRDSGLRSAGSGSAARPAEVGRSPGDRSDVPGADDRGAARQGCRRGLGAARASRSSLDSPSALVAPEPLQDGGELRAQVAKAIAGEMDEDFDGLEAGKEEMLRAADAAIALVARHPHQDVDEVERLREAIDRAVGVMRDSEYVGGPLQRDAWREAFAVLAPLATEHKAASPDEGGER